MQACIFLQAVLLVTACLAVAQPISRDPSLPVSFQGSALLVKPAAGLAASRRCFLQSFDPYRPPLV